MFYSGKRGAKNFDFIFFIDLFSPPKQWNNTDKSSEKW